MGGLMALLLPEIVGLMVTPGAVIGCVLLLRSRDPVRNASMFGLGFLVVYSIVALAACIGGAPDPGATTAQTSHIAGLVVGLIFLALGVVMLVRPRRHTGEKPRVLDELATAGPRKAFAIGVVLGVLNPNLFIMMSGMSVIASSAVGLADALLATAILLVAAVVDFLIPIGIYLAMGERAERSLAVAQAWMLSHSRMLTLSVLLGFGALFTARGIVNLAG
ncbi:GAP family protein [Nocardia sp. NPDC056541]|uniref:GAP family protein n=1 Tax=Nocardia sp. NPDC056541 TaxID=3345860 RepID=UPI00366C60DB